MTQEFSTYPERTEELMDPHYEQLLQDLTQKGQVIAPPVFLTMMHWFADRRTAQAESTENLLYKMRLSSIAAEYREAIKGNEQLVVFCETKASLSDLLLFQSFKTPDNTLLMGKLWRTSVAWKNQAEAIRKRPPL